MRYVLVLSLILLVLWVVNVLEFSKCDFQSPYQCEIIHGIGIVVVPLGWVFGFIDFGK